MSILNSLYIFYCYSTCVLFIFAIKDLSIYDFTITVSYVASRIPGKFPLRGSTVSS